MTKKDLQTIILTIDMNKETNNYKDLVTFSKQVYANKSIEVYKLYISTDDLYIFKCDKTNNIISGELKYTFENPCIYNFLKDLLEVNDSEYGEYIIYSNNSNKYQFIMNYNILDILLTTEVIKSRNEEVNKKFKLTCKNGKIRDIVAPHKSLIPLFENLNRLLQHIYDNRNSSFQVAYKLGKSIKSNALPHAKNKNVYKVDLHNFFPSCKRKYVEKYISFLFKNTINSTFVKEKFMEIILDNDALFIGNPISGTLANVIISKPVAYMKNICDKFDITFSVYADDMTFSSNKYLTKKFITTIFNRAFVKYDMENDFSLNEKKCCGQSKTNRHITGVAVNIDNKVTCSRYIYNEIRMTLHQLSYGDESHFNYNRLKGKISFMMMLDESGKLVKLLNRYKETVFAYDLVSLNKLDELNARISEEKEGV